MDEPKLYTDGQGKTEEEEVWGAMKALVICLLASAVGMALLAFLVILLLT